VGWSELAGEVVLQVQLRMIMLPLT